MDAGGEKCGGDAAGEAGSDLYAVLGLKKECSDAELKVAYRKLAMRWHPDKCSSSNSVKHMEEAKEKFQEIQSAYSVLSDANKRFLYDVGVYNDEDDEDSLQGMGDFIGEMAQMMSQARPTRQESFEELQQLFVDMFQSDLDSGFCNGPTKGHQVHGQTQSRTSSTSPSSSPSPPPPNIVMEAEVRSCNGFNKRCSSAMDSAKPPRPVEAGAGQSQAGFCFGVNALVINSIPILLCLITMQCGRKYSYLNLSDYVIFKRLLWPTTLSFHIVLQMSDTKQAPKARGQNTSRRRNGRKQKLSSKHDVSSEDDTAGSQLQQHVAV
nr:unnamed protein product [Digitaria exilis]